MKTIFVLIVIAYIAFGAWQIDTVTDCCGGYVSVALDSEGYPCIAHGIL